MTRLRDTGRLLAEMDRASCDNAHAPFVTNVTMNDVPVTTTRLVKGGGRRVGIWMISGD